MVENLRTGVGEDTLISAGAVVGEAREGVATDQPEVLPNNVLARLVVGTEPGLTGGRGGLTW